MTAGSVDWMRGLLGGRRARADAQSKATTGGGRQSGEPVEVYRALNEAEAMVVKGFLESDDIPVMLRWESIGPTLGISVGALAEVSVMVPEALAPRATELLEAQARLAGLEDDEGDGDEGLDPPADRSIG